MARGGDLDSNRIITMDGMEFLMNWEEGGGEGEAEGASNDAPGAAAARPLQPSGEAVTTAATVSGGQPQHRKANSGSWQFDPVLLPPPGVAPTAEDPRQPAASVSVGPSSLGPSLGAASHASSANASSGTAAADVAAAAYFLAQGATHLHPLAMTSLASCPPHATNFVTLPQPSNGQAARQDGQVPPPAPPFAPPPAAPTGGTVFNFPSIVTNANNANPGVLPGGADQNAAFAAHLSELAANFQSSNAAAATSLHGHVPAPLHFGMTVNGFHPQVNAQVNPLQMPTSLPGVGGVSGSLLGVGGGMAAAPAKPLAGTCPGALPRRNSLTAAANQASATNAVSVATSTAISTHQRNARDRNEREQVRAKKITELITELRVNMQQGGWKEEMKSKYQTLSQCREYMVHLQRSHAAKEQDIAKTKQLVAEKAAMLEAQAKSEEADGASDMQCSDHDQTESVTSSLTDSTVRSSDANGMDCSSTSSGDRSEEGSNKSRNIAREEAAPAAEVPANKKGCRKSSRHRRTKRKKKPVAGESSAETSSTSEEDGEDGGNEFPGGKNIQFDKTSSSVSDMTDSNRGSAARRGGAGDGSTSSISSTAAVVRGLGSSRDSGPSSRHRKRRQSLPGNLNGTLPAVEEEKAPHAAGTKEAATKPVTCKKKRRSSSHYNYREVFLKSNVPQLIATLSGRIVVWNEFFLTATGLSERDAKRLTIFSIVESDQLSSLYKMVARALAEKGGVSSGGSDPTGSTSGPATSATESSATKSECTDDEEWQAITLKCTSFPSHAKDGDGDKKATHHPNPLYITVALMEDENRDQRCFHCILTDRPGTEPGKLGSVTPELFALLFAPKAKKAVA